MFPLCYTYFFTFQKHSGLAYESFHEIYYTKNKYILGRSNIQKKKTGDWFCQCKVMQFIMRCAFVGCLGIGWYDVKNQRVLHEVFAGTSFLLAVIHSVLFTHIEYNQMVKDIRQENQTFFVMFYQKTRAKVFERLLQGPYYLKFCKFCQKEQKKKRKRMILPSNLTHVIYLFCSFILYCFEFLFILFVVFLQ